MNFVLDLEKFTDSLDKRITKFTDQICKDVDQGKVKRIRTHSFICIGDFDLK